MQNLYQHHQQRNLMQVYMQLNYDLQKLFYTNNKSNKIIIVNYLFICFIFLLTKPYNIELPVINSEYSFNNANNDVC